MELNAFSSSIKCSAEERFDYFDPADPIGSMQKLGQTYLQRKEQELESKRVVKDGLEQQYTLDYYHVGQREAKKRRKMERNQSAGSAWFDMKAPELTDEVKRDLEVIQMRRALFRKHQYKRKATEKTPEHFHMGKVIEGTGDFYSSRLPRKERTKSIVDELIKDATFQRNAKQRYERIAGANSEKKKAKALRKKQLQRKQLVRKKLSSKDWKNRSEEHKKDKREQQKLTIEGSTKGTKSLKGAKKHQKRLKKNK